MKPIKLTITKWRRAHLYGLNLTIALMIVLSGLLTCVRAADYQWSVSVEDTNQPDIDPGYPRAFLWIPSDCKQVRGVVISQNNMEEKSILENDNFRKAMANLGFAEVWITPTLGSIHFRFDQGFDKKLDKVLKGLADISGYQEIAYAPLIPMGHSASASWGWDIAAWNPDRVLAVLSISGQWPYYKDTNMDINSSPDWGDQTVDGVPGLITKGEYEVQGSLITGWYAGLKGDSLQKHPKTVLTQVVEPGGDHFAATQEKIDLIAFFLKKAAQYRLPADAPSNGPPTLTPIDPTTTGWLYDVWRLNQEPTSPSGRVADYAGNKDQAFWAFDQETAKAIEDFQSKLRNKKPVLIGYKQKDGLTAPTPDHAMIHLKFEPQDDGLTFKFSGGFFDTVPPQPDGGQPSWGIGLSEGGTPLPAGATIDHPQNADNQIVLSVICGPLLQTAPDTFVLHPTRTGTQDSRRSGDAWLVATYPGDDTYKRAMQQADFGFPFKNTAGDAQTITFPEISDQKTGAGAVKLQATASSGAPIAYYVREGPAEVNNDGNLTLTKIPPRAKFPVKVTVVATQWGRSNEPRLQTADPVERTFSVTDALHP